MSADSEDGRSNKVMWRTGTLDTQLSSPPTLSRVHHLNSATEQQTTEGRLMEVPNLHVQSHLIYMCASAHSAVSTLCDSTDYSPPGSSVHGIFQARILEWVAISSSRGIFSSRGNYLLCLLHWQVDSLPLSHLGSIIWYVCPPQIIICYFKGFWDWLSHHSKLLYFSPT